MMKAKTLGNASAELPREWPPAPAGETALFARLEELCERGAEISAQSSDRH